MKWWQTPFSVLVAVLSFLLLPLLHSFLNELWSALGLDIARHLYCWWVRAYTVFMDPKERTARLLDIQADIEDYIARHRNEYRSGDIGVRLLVRLLGEIPGDLIEGVLAIGPASIRFYRVNRCALTDRTIAAVGTLIQGICMVARLGSRGTGLQVAAEILSGLTLAVSLQALSETFSVAAIVFVVGLVVEVVFEVVIGFTFSLVVEVVGGVVGLVVGVVVGIVVSVLIMKLRENVYDGTPAGWPTSKALLAMAPMALPLIIMIWRSISVWRMLTVEVFVVVLWQVGLFLVDKAISRRRSGPPSMPPPIPA
jgi:hypothetical protein